MAKIGIVTIHGMDTQQPSFDNGLEQSLRSRFGPTVSNDVVFREIYYRGLLQPRQDAVWACMGLDDGWLPRPWRKVWVRVRRFLIFRFSDTAREPSRRPGRIPRTGESPERSSLHHTTT